MRRKLETKELQKHGLKIGKVYMIHPHENFKEAVYGKLEMVTDHVLFFMTEHGFYVTVTLVNHRLGWEKITEVKR